MKHLKDFSISETRTSSLLRLSLVGAISESARMDLPVMNNEGMLEIDLEGVSMINSAGVRRLVMWLSELDKQFPRISIRLVRILPPISRQLTVLKSHLPKRMQVRSIFVVHFCEACDVEDDSVLLHRGHLGPDGHPRTVEGVSCPKCGNAMVYDDDCNRLMSLLSA